MRDSKLSPRSKLHLRSSGTLRRADELFSYRRFGTFSIFRRQAVQDECLDRLILKGGTDKLSRNIGNTNLSRVNSQQNEDLVFYLRTRPI